MLASVRDVLLALTEVYWLICIKRCGRTLLAPEDV